MTTATLLFICGLLFSLVGIICVMFTAYMFSDVNDDSIKGWIIGVGLLVSWYLAYQCMMNPLVTEMIS